MPQPRKAPYLTVEIENQVLGRIIHDGPCVLQGVMVGFAGCSQFIIRDGERNIFKMPTAFAASWYVGMAVYEKLIIDLVGNPPAHVHLSYRPANEGA